MSNKTKNTAIFAVFVTIIVGLGVYAFFVNGYFDFLSENGLNIPAMPNEALLFFSVLMIYGGIIVFYTLFGKNGLFAYTVIATIAANIEVLIQIKAFGMGMTLGNVLFAATFLVTDIISEIYGKKDAKKAVHIGIASTLMFLFLSNYWLMYSPSKEDFAMDSMQTIFTNSARLMIASVIVYFIVQEFDVWAYHKWWEFTDKKFGNHQKFLWLRNNGSTLFSQLLNTVLYAAFAYLGTFSASYIGEIIISSYVIFIVTSILDTPFVYIARYISRTRTEEK